MNKVKRYDVRKFKSGGINFAVEIPEIVVFITRCHRQVLSTNSQRLLLLVLLFIAVCESLCKSQVCTFMSFVFSVSGVSRNRWQGNNVSSSLLPFVTISFHLKSFFIWRFIIFNTLLTYNFVSIISYYQLISSLKLFD